MWLTLLHIHLHLQDMAQSLNMLLSMAPVHLPDTQAPTAHVAKAVI